ncbi:hypothetical protein [Oxobacter pfennigii]
METTPFNRAYKQVKNNNGAPGIDGMLVDDALPWLKEKYHLYGTSISGSS